MPEAVKIAVAGATGRAGHHVVDVLTERGYDVVAISRGQGVDVITGSGLAAALEGVSLGIHAATGPYAEQDPATEFFTAVRNLHQAIQRAGVEQMIVMSIMGTDRTAAATAWPSRLTSRPRWTGRSRPASCAPRSSTSSSRS
jgi:uncharacterized protein YbjT (DUF2867 family)